METNNLYAGGPKNIGVNTPEKDKLGNKEVEQNEQPNTSGDSEPQDGKNIVNEQDQNRVVNGDGGEAAEEYITSAGNNTRKANDTPFNNENGVAAQQ